MRPDLQGLEITKGELKRLSGVGSDDVLRSPKFSKLLAEIAQTLSILFLLGISAVFLKFIFPERLLWIIIVHLAAAVGLVIDDCKKIYFTRQHKNLLGLFEDVDRYNDIIRAIDINDQIEAAGNPQVSLQDRDKVIAALELTRLDLVRALRTERILRKNKQFIARNPELFANNLTALAALQVSDRASEHGRLLNEALQVALSAREEMRKLQDRQLN